MDDLDREDFCSRLELVCSGGAAEVLAWCLMSNHVHLAMRSLSCPLSHTMRRLLTGYAMRFNERHGRVGHLFQNRYKTTVIASERYLLTLVRYIHLNPVEAGMVRSLAELEEYAWCGHGALLGHPARSFQAADEIIGRFGSETEQARQELHRFMGDRSAAQGEAQTFDGGGLKRSVGGIEAMRRLQSDMRQGKAALVAHDPRVLGDSDTVASLLAAEKEQRHAAILSPQRRAVALQRMLENVSRYSGLTMVELCGQSRRHVVVLWRRVAAYLAVTHLGASAAEASRLLGLSTTPVLVAIAKGPGLVEKLGLNVRDLLE